MTDEQEDELNVGIFNLLTETALEDGKITSNEMDVIRSILSNVEHYIELLDKAIDDGIITHKEKISLINQRKQILNDAYETATDDFEVTQAEFNLLNNTVEILQKLENKELSYIDDTK